MSTPTLGCLERVDLRTAWKNEASHFTPWLASPENMALVGDKKIIAGATPSGKLQVAYWRSFGEFLTQNKAQFKPPSPYPSNWVLWGLDRACWRSGKTLPRSWMARASYEALLADRGDYLLPWTAYTVAHHHQRQKLRREYEAWLTA